MIDSPVFPTSSSAAGAARAGAASRSVACSRRTATGTTCSGVSRSPARARRRRDDRGAARAAPGRAQRALRDFDERHYVDAPGAARARLGRGAAGPGLLRARRARARAAPADGHTVDGMAIWIPWAGVLVCGDYLSPVEIPTPEASIDGYLATLARLEPLVEAAEHVVPGHGGPIDGRGRPGAVAEDRAIWRRCATDGRPPPRCRRPPRRRAAPLHAANLARLSASWRPMNRSRPGQAAVGLARGGEAERLVERDRGVVVLVGVELDSPRAARAGALECGEHQRTADALAARRALSTNRSSSQQSGALGPDRVAEAQLADAARGGVAIDAAEQVLGARVAIRRSTEAANASSGRPVRLEPVAKRDQQPRDVAASSVLGPHAHRRRPPPRRTPADFPRGDVDHRERIARRRPRPRRRSAAPLTVPALWAVISFSIFIASMIAIRAPCSTCAPSRPRPSARCPASGWPARRRRAPALGGALHGRAAIFGLGAGRRGVRRRARRSAADHAHVEAAPADLDRVVERHRVRRSLAARWAGAQSPRATGRPRAGRGRSRRAPTARWRAAAGGTASAWSARSISYSPSARSIRARRRVAIGVPDDQLGDHRVVVRRDLRARDDARVDAHARPRRLAIARRCGPGGREVAAPRPRR